MGYKYFNWNCDRGLLSKNKLDDIKRIADKHHPHFMGISEINLRKNENNTNDNSMTEFSTEQLLDIFYIEGYKIILPDSWDKHGVARVLVYANDELNVKKHGLKDEESHLQSIILEISIGKGLSKKTLISPNFMCNFLLNRWSQGVVLLRTWSTHE